MIYYEVKRGRTELTGKIAGVIYKIVDDGKEYYYLINILNPDDIHIIFKPNSIKLGKELDEKEIPSNLKEFHEQVKLLKKDAVSTEAAKKALREKQDAIKAEQAAKRRTYINKYYVHSAEATEFLLSEIGEYDLKNVKTQYFGSNFQVYVIENTYKFTVLRDRITRKNTYSLISLEEEKRIYSEKLKRFMSELNLPAKICKIFINYRFTEEKAIVVLKQINDDKKKPETLSQIKTPYQYMDDLILATEVRELVYLDTRKFQIIYDFVFKGR